MDTSSSMGHMNVWMIQTILMKICINKNHPHNIQKMHADVLQGPMQHNTLWSKNVLCVLKNIVGVSIIVIHTMVNIGDI